MPVDKKSNKFDKSNPPFWHEEMRMEMMMGTMMGTMVVTIRKKAKCVQVYQKLKKEGEKAQRVARKARKKEAVFGSSDSNCQSVWF